MPKFGMGHLPRQRLVSPPSPTAHWETSQRIGVQGFALQAGHQAGPVERPPRPSRPATLDLRRFPPAVSRASTAWRHNIRNLDAESRLWLPELMTPGPDTAVVGGVGRDRWELTLGSSPVAAPAITCDKHGRVLVPLSIRRTPRS